MSSSLILPVSDFAISCISSESNWTRSKAKLTTTGGLAFGGTHLPDLTIVTPVFDAQGKEIIFWAASRGHHADVSSSTLLILLFYCV